MGPIEGPADYPPSHSHAKISRGSKREKKAKERDATHIRSSLRPRSFTTAEGTLLRDRRALEISNCNVIRRARGEEGRAREKKKRRRPREREKAGPKRKQRGAGRQ